MSWKTKLKNEYPHLYNPEVISLIESIRREVIMDVIEDIPDEAYLPKISYGGDDLTSLKSQLKQRWLGENAL